MTQPVIDDQPEKRATIAKEILSSEVAYLRTLQSIKEVFFLPCKAALDSNRAVLSHQNMQIIFTDAMALMELSKSVRILNSFSKKLPVTLRHEVLAADHLSRTLGDALMTGARISAWETSLSNSVLIWRLTSISSTITPWFCPPLRRARSNHLCSGHWWREERRHLPLKCWRRHSPPHIVRACSIQTTYHWPFCSSLAELMLAPARRIGEYVTLLTWFQSCTPSDHADKSDIAQAIKIYGRLEKFICEVNKLQNSIWDPSSMAVFSLIKYSPLVSSASKDVKGNVNYSIFKPKSTPVL